MLVFSQLRHWANMSVLARVGCCDETKRVKIYNDFPHNYYFLLIYQFRSVSYRSDFDIVRRTSVVTLLSLQRIGIVKGTYQNNCDSENVKHN